MIIVLVLGIRGRLLPSRSDTRQRLASVGPGKVGVAGVVWFALGLALILMISQTWLSAVTTSLVTAVVVLSVVVVTGYAGQLSLCQLAFAGVAAYLAAVFSSDVVRALSQVWEIMSTSARPRANQITPATPTRPGPTRASRWLVSDREGSSLALDPEYQHDDDERRRLGPARGPYVPASPRTRRRRSAWPRAASAGNDSNLPTRAAAMAGITSSVRVSTDMPVIGAIRIMPQAAMADPIAQVAAATMSGDQPMEAATCGFSATALVASPNRVRRCMAMSPPVRTTPMTAQEDLVEPDRNWCRSGAPCWSAAGRARTWSARSARTRGWPRRSAPSSGRGWRRSSRVTEACRSRSSTTRCMRQPMVAQAIRAATMAACDAQPMVMCSL